MNAGECKLQSCPLAAGRRGLGGKPQTPKQQAPLAREGGAQTANRDRPRVSLAFHPAFFMSWFFLALALYSLGRPVFAFYF